MLLQQVIRDAYKFLTRSVLSQGTFHGAKAQSRSNCFMRRTFNLRVDFVKFGDRLKSIGPQSNIGQKSTLLTRENKINCPLH